tara:strand:+ start:127 stop:1128 length:1002 start_codon:yes stop_codon:yes gene_type:complete
MVGKEPFITCHGYLMPCCWLDIPRYSTDRKIYDSNGQLKPNIFHIPEFNLSNHDYKSIVESSEWLLMLEKLHLEDYNPCNMKCKDFFAFNDKIVLSEYKVDDLVYDDKLIRSTNEVTFNRSLVDTWEVSSIQIELTNRCSLKCPYCPRLTDKVQKSDLPVSIIKEVLSCKHWKEINDVGSYGDSIFYPKYHEFLNIVSESSVEKYIGHIAATGRGKDWWDDTIRHYKKSIKTNTDITVLFGVDGLEDTSKLHRIGQDWDEITYAMKECAASGVNVVWQYIPMSFNEHQIEEAKELAKKWNIKFQLHLSCRFMKNDPNKPKTKNLFRDFYEDSI